VTAAPVGNPVGQTFVTELDSGMRALADAARAVRPVEPTVAFERLHAACRSAQRALGADDPLRLQASVMVAAIDDAVAAMRRLGPVATPTPS
jgi:hypothetical protein